MAELEDVLIALDSGSVVVVPTDTVYGLAARLDRPGAIDAIFDLKGRPRDKPLPVLGDGVDPLETIATFDSDAYTLAERFWPGPLTLVLRRARGFDVDLGGATGDPTVGVRVPASPPLLRLLAGSGPLAVTSANLSGQPPAHFVEEARLALGDGAAAYLDGGASGGTASTVVSLVDGFRVLREGPLGSETLLACLGDSP